jgi:hypothetical protein
VKASNSESLLGLRFELHDGGRPYVAYPSLRDVRWILPVDPLLRRAGISSYAPARVRGRLLKALITGAWLRGDRVWLNEGSLAQLETRLGRILGAPELRLAFSIGTPGTYCKVTAQVMTPRGRVLAYAKLARLPLARMALETERHNLMRLATTDLVHGRIPEVIDRFDWTDSAVLLITPGPAQPGPRQLSEAHLEVLCLFHKAFTEMHSFTESPMWVRMAAAVDRLSPGLPDPWTARYRRALDYLQAKLGRLEVPVSLAHRDFAPWNTRWGPRGLFVFDWESAAEGVAPLYDAFNFQAIQAALGRRTYRPPYEFLGKWLESLWPEGTPHIDSLYLAYLVDLSLFYRESTVLSPDDDDETVWRWLGMQIDACVEARNGMA